MFFLTFAAAETPADNDFENAPVDTWCESEDIARIELPARVKIRIHGDHQLMLLNGDRIEAAERAQ